MDQHRWISLLIAVITVAYLTLAGIIVTVHNNAGLAVASAYYLYPIQTSTRENVLEHLASASNTTAQSSSSETDGARGDEKLPGVIPAPTPVPEISVEPVHWTMPVYQGCVACHATGLPPLPGRFTKEALDTITETGAGVTSQDIASNVLPQDHLPTGSLSCLSCHVDGIPSFTPTSPTGSTPDSTLPMEEVAGPPGIPTLPSTSPPSNYQPQDTLPPNHPAAGGLPCINCHPNGVPTTAPTTTTTPATLSPAPTSTGAPVTTTSAPETSPIPTTATTTTLPTTVPADTLPHNHPATGGLPCITCHPAGIPTTTLATQPTSIVTAPTIPTVQPTITTTTLTPPTTASQTTPPAVSTTEPPTDMLPPNHPATGGLACIACHPNGIPTSTVTTVPTTTVVATIPNPTVPMPTETVSLTTSQPTNTEPPATSTTPPAHYTLPEYHNCQSCHGSSVPPIPTSTTQPGTTPGTTPPATSTSLLPPGHLAIGSKACNDCHTDSVATTPVPTVPHDHPDTHTLLCTYCHTREYDDD